MDGRFLTILIFMPLIAGILLLFFNKPAVKKIAFAFTLLELALTLVLFFSFKNSALPQFVVKKAWLSDL